MATFNGIPIADPSKKGLNFTTKEGFRPPNGLDSSVVEGVTTNTGIDSHYNNALKDVQLPHIKHDVHSSSITSDPQDITQEATLKSRDDYESVKGFRVVNEVTVPIDNLEHTEIDDRQYVDDVDFKASVEEPMLEAGKNLTDMNGAGYFDPGLGEHNLMPVQKYGRPKTDIPTKISNPKGFAEEQQYLYIDGKKGFQDKYYKNNTWRDGYRDGTNEPTNELDPNTGRVHLFEAPRTPSIRE